MLFFYVRHGDPTYHPDALTPLGRRQADAVAKRLALFGLDRVYCSTSNRAIETAQPTCELLKLEATELDFANEHHAWMELGVMLDGRRRWLFASPGCARLAGAGTSTRRLPGTITRAASSASRERATRCLPRSDTSISAAAVPIAPSDQATSGSRSLHIRASGSPSSHSCSTYPIRSSAFSSICVTRA